MKRTLFGFEKPVDFISGHGTATSFNDETESIGFDRAGLNKVPVNSLKPYFGHMLGAAGVTEIVVSGMSMEEGLVLKTPGYEKHGVSREINVLKNNMKGEFSTCLKTASGFGGCNATVLLCKKGMV
jgi:3-oxoacyl-[acyl-carrier-protein] synthase I